MTRGFEPTVARIMDQVQKTVRSQPGLLSVETLRDIQDHHRYVVLSTWATQQHYESWLASSQYKSCTAKVNEVLDVPGKKTRMFKQADEDIFLL